MSKSKKNTVDPASIIKAYGADAARLFMLSDSPPDRDLEWSDEGIKGAWRYINRVWRLSANHAELWQQDIPAIDTKTLPAELEAIYSQTHRTIDTVTQAIEQFHFNKAIATLRELTNALEAVKADTSQSKAVITFALETVLVLINPFLPHLAEECWHILNKDTLIAHAPWPQADPAFLIDDTVTLAIQVNGKLRATIEAARDGDKESLQAEALQLPAIQAHIAEKEIRKVIVVPNRIINIVVK